MTMTTDFSNPAIAGSRCEPDLSFDCVVAKVCFTQGDTAGDLASAFATMSAQEFEVGSRFEVASLRSLSAFSG